MRELPSFVSGNSSRSYSQCTEPLDPLKRIVLEFVTIPLGQNSSRQDKMLQKKNIFPDLLTLTATVRWIKQKVTQTPGR